MSTLKLYIFVYRDVDKKVNSSVEPFPYSHFFIKIKANYMYQKLKDRGKNVLKFEV